MHYCFYYISRFIRKSNKNCLYLFSASHLPLTKLYYVIITKAHWESYWHSCFKHEENEAHKNIKVTQPAFSEHGSYSQLFMTPKPTLLPYIIFLKTIFMISSKNVHDTHYGSTFLWSEPDFMKEKTVKSNHKALNPG